MRRFSFSPFQVKYASLVKFPEMVLRLRGNWNMKPANLEFHQRLYNCNYWRLCLAVLCFTPKQVFGPRIAKSQPIWIKCCTHLLLYRMHLWAYLDRDRRVGGCKSNQNDYVLVILVTHPKSYIETTDRRDFGGKPSAWRWGRVLSWKIPKFCSVGGARSKTAFSPSFRVPFDYPAHSLQETVLQATTNAQYRMMNTERFNKKVSYRKQITRQHSRKIFPHAQLDRRANFGCCFPYCLRACRRSQNWGDAEAPPPCGEGVADPLKHAFKPHVLPYQIWSL